MVDNLKKILIIDFSNYEDYPIGGYLTFARYLMSAFGDSLSLIGITTSKGEPVGKWFNKKIDNINYDFFALARYNKARTKHAIPDRLMSYLSLKYYKKEILKKNIQNVFIQRQEIMPAVSGFKFSNICYRFPGLDNPLRNSKYRFGRSFTRHFDKIFFPSLKNAKVLLATGDDREIVEMSKRSNNLIPAGSVVKFPTRVDTEIFKPSDKCEARKQLKIPGNSFIVMTSGRLAWFKGWKFMIDSFICFMRSIPDTYFYFVGDGEDYQKIKDYIDLKGITGRVILSGRKTAAELSLYLNAADLYIMGSYQEGWSTTLTEAIACGIPSCTTDFSSAKELIIEGKNGYVIDIHNEELFAEGMLKARDIERPAYNENVKNYSVNKLKNDLLNIWELV